MPAEAAAALGDPTPYQTKLLHIEYLIVGHDAERRTEAPEATASGYEANFIMQRKGIVERVLTNNDEGKAYCQEHVLIGIPTIMPTVEVRYASYGHPTKPKFNWNVTEVRISVCGAFTSSIRIVSGNDEDGIGPRRP